jgi:hypothetical protein
MAELMLEWFHPQRSFQQFPQRAVVGATPQRRAQIYFDMVAETGTHLSIGGQPHLVAAFAEMLVRERADEANPGTGLFQPKI